MKAACVLLIAAGVALMVLPAEAASPPNREVARHKHEVARLKAKVTGQYGPLRAPTGETHHRAYHSDDALRTACLT
jgi:hypothetical protein